MEEVVKTDDMDTIEVVVRGLEVDAVRISNSWRKRYEAEALAEKLSELIRDAMPPREVPRQPTLGNKHLPISSIPAFLEEMRRGREATRRYIRRLRAGEVERPEPDQRQRDTDGRIEVSIVGGRFNAVFINPEWAANTTTNALCDTLLATLPTPLIQELERDEDLAEARRHYEAARRYMTEK